MLNKYLILILMIAAFSIGGCSNTGLERGILQGNVTIGPISPVERPGETPTIPCEVYEARKIMVYDEKGGRLIQQIDIDCDGRYMMELKPGIYTIDINRIGIDHSSDVPQKVEIKSSIALRLDIDIDTGIR
ncbi:hypothetical protein ACFLVX_00810 [Chloroflexota bacterium]